LKSNPPTADLHLTQGSGDFLWAVFAVMLFADLIAIALSFFKRPQNHLYRQIAIIILTTSSIAYFSMASDLGHTPINVEFDFDGRVGTRDVWYVRYIQWFINAPLLVLLTYLGTGVPLINSYSTLFMADALVVQGLVGALVSSQYKWGYYTMGVFSLIYVVSQIILNAIRSTDVAATSGRRGSGFIVTAGIMSALWLIYPLVWALSDGSNTLSTTGEVVWYGCLDALAGPVFLAFFLW
ncbi:family A G protein-coupled receptor-like protein, partial [Artomyces pyxidatus]